MLVDCSAFLLCLNPNSAYRSRPSGSGPHRDTFYEKWFDGLLRAPLLPMTFLLYTPHLDLVSTNLLYPILTLFIFHQYFLLDRNCELLQKSETLCKFFKILVQKYCFGNFKLLTFLKFQKFPPNTISEYNY